MRKLPRRGIEGANLIWVRVVAERHSSPLELRNKWKSSFSGQVGLSPQATTLH